MPLKQSTDPFYLTRGLRSPGTVEVVFYSQSLRDPLDDLGSEGQSIVTLESPGKSKSRDNLIN
jgi:hypothetical protein